MPGLITRKPEIPKTGIPWVDSFLQAMQQDPGGGFGPTPMAGALVPAEIAGMRGSKGAASQLIQALKKMSPKVTKAFESRPDVAVEYPVQEGWEELGRYYDPIEGQPGGKISISSKAATGAKTDPRTVALHEALHALYQIKGTGGYPPSQYQSAIANRYGPNIRGWGKSSEGERAIEGLVQNILERGKPLAKAKYRGLQSGFGHVPDFNLWDLLEEIPGHSAGSTVGEETLKEAGFRIPRR